MAVAGFSASVVHNKRAAKQHRTYSGILRIEPSLYSENRKRQRHYLTTIKFCTLEVVWQTYLLSCAKFRIIGGPFHFVVDEQKITTKNSSTTPLFGLVNAMSRLPTKEGGAAFPKPMPVISVSDLQGRR